MTDYEIYLTPAQINFAPLNEVQEILQNVITICTTSKFSVPLDREFGVDTQFIDEPINGVRAKYSAEVIQAVRKFEPRARISGISFEQDNSGTVRPRVRVKIIDA